MEVGVSGATEQKTGLSGELLWLEFGFAAADTDAMLDRRIVIVAAVQNPLPLWVRLPKSRYATDPDTMPGGLGEVLPVQGAQ